MGLEPAALRAGTAGFLAAVPLIWFESLQLLEQNGGCGSAAPHTGSASSGCSGGEYPPRTHTLLLGALDKRHIWGPQDHPWVHVPQHPLHSAGPPLRLWFRAGKEAPGPAPPGPSRCHRQLWGSESGTRPAGCGGAPLRVQLPPQITHKHGPRPGGRGWAPREGCARKWGGQQVRGHRVRVCGPRSWGSDGETGLAAAEVRLVGSSHGSGVFAEGFALWSSACWVGLGARCWRDVGCPWRPWGRAHARALSSCRAGSRSPAGHTSALRVLAIGRHAVGGMEPGSQVCLSPSILGSSRQLASCPCSVSPPWPPPRSGRVWGSFEVPKQDHPTRVGGAPGKAAGHRDVATGHLSRLPYSPLASSVAAGLQRPQASTQHGCA